VIINFEKIKRPYFVAEISANHDSSIKVAKKLILLAKKSGADAVKLQTFTPETITVNSQKKEFLIKEGKMKGRTLWELYAKAQTPLEWHKELFLYSKSIGITCFSSPFDETAVDFLEKLNCPMYKVASPEIMHFPLIKRISETKKPVIISTGMATLKEIDLAYNYTKSLGVKQIALLYCVSNYPSEVSDFNLNNIIILKKKYKTTIGLSDHSLGHIIGFSSVLLGAEIIEKHIALDNSRTLDSDFSAKGKEIKLYKEKINEAYNLLGKKYFYRNKNEMANRRYRRSIYAVQDIKKGDKFSKTNIRVIRPSRGLSPVYYNNLLKKISPFIIKKYSPIKKIIIKKVKIKKIL